MCVYVMYPNIMTIPGVMFSLGTGGGAFVPGGEIPHFPRSPENPFFFERVKKTMRNPRLQEVHNYKHCISKLHHNCKQKQFQSVLIMYDLIPEKERLFA